MKIKSIYFKFITTQTAMLQQFSKETPNYPIRPKHQLPKSIMSREVKSSLKETFVQGTSSHVDFCP